jgi:HK97 family phage major capsid protein
MSASALHVRRAQVWEEAKKLLSDAEGRSFTADELSKHEAMLGEVESLTAKIGAEERSAKLAAAFESSTGQPVAGGGAPAPAVDEYRSQFEAYLKHGTEIRGTSAQAAGNDELGGFLVPDSMRATIIEKLKDFGGLRALAENLTTGNGQTLYMPTSNQTTIKGQIIAENAATTVADISFGQKAVGAYLYSSDMVKTSRILLQDAIIDVPAYVGKALGERIGRIQADHWILGTGVNQPTGIDVGRDTTLDVNTTAAITFDNLISLIHQIDPAYRRMPGTSFVMNDATLAAVRKIKTGISSDNTTLWQPSMQAGTPDMLLGYPVVIDPSVEADSSGKRPVFFGNFREAYLIRDVAGITVLRLDERFADNLQVAFVGFMRSDAIVKQTAAYAAIDRTS